jgi:hypothetical protein
MDTASGFFSDNLLWKVQVGRDLEICNPVLEDADRGKKTTSSGSKQIATLSQLLLTQWMEPPRPRWRSVRARRSHARFRFGQRETRPPTLVHDGPGHHYAFLKRSQMHKSRSADSGFAQFEIVQYEITMLDSLTCATRGLLNE